MISRRKFSKEFKLAAVRRIEAGEAVPYLARVLEVSPNDLYRWHRESQQLGGRAIPIKTCARSAKIRQSWVSLASANVVRDTLPRNPMWYNFPPTERRHASMSRKLSR